MAQKKEYFGARIDPACEYCKFGTLAQTKTSVLCSKQGLVDLKYSCKKWVYDPIKRVPKRQIERDKLYADLILKHNKELEEMHKRIDK